MMWLKNADKSPEVRVVNVSAVCTLALAGAGAMPRLSKTVVEVTPYAIPRARAPF